MSCSRYDPTLFLHAHGQLGAAKRWQLENHLRGCAECRANWASWCVEKDHLRRAFTPLPVDTGHTRDLVQLVSARIRAEAPHPPNVSIAHTASAAAGRLVMVMVSAVSLIAVLTVSALASFRPATDPLTSREFGALPLALCATTNEGAQAANGKSTPPPHSHLVSNQSGTDLQCSKCRKAIAPPGEELTQAR